MSASQSTFGIFFPLQESSTGSPAHLNTQAPASSVLGAASGVKRSSSSSEISRGSENGVFLDNGIHPDSQSLNDADGALSEC